MAAPSISPTASMVTGFCGFGWPSISTRRTSSARMALEFTSSRPMKKLPKETAKASSTVVLPVAFSPISTVKFLLNSKDWCLIPLKFVMEILCIFTSDTLGNGEPKLTEEDCGLRNGVGKGY